MTVNRRPSWRRVAADARPHGGVLLAGTLASLVETGLMTASPLVVAYGMDRGVLAGRRDIVIGSGLAYLALSMAAMAAAYFGVRLVGAFAQRYMRSLRSTLLDQLYALDLDFFTRERAGRLVSRLTSDVEALQQFLETGVPALTRAVLVIVITTAVMWAACPPLTAAALTALLPLVIATLWFRKRSFAAQVELRERMAEMLSHVSESLMGLRVVQAYTIEDARLSRFSAVNDNTLQARLRVAKVATLYVPVVELAMPMALCVVLAYGSVLASDGVVGVGTVMAFALYVTRLFEPIVQLSELANVVQSAAAALSKIFSFRDERPQVTDAPDAVDLRPGPGAVALERVTFGYSPGRPPVLRDIDLRIEPGERIALVGGSGAGKSTLARLIARFYDPTEGRITVDAQDVRTVTGSSLRRHVLLVPQEAFLFDGTVADNIAMARPGAGRADAVRACESLGVLEALERLPEGLDTTVANHGLTLSSGQRQLVSLARVFVADARVVILDEATSNVDPGTELLVENALRTLLQGRTALVIAHRLASAMRADRVLFLAEGRVVEQGPPAELAAAGGAFSHWLAASREPLPEEA